MNSFLKFVLAFIIVLILSVILTPILFDFLPFKFARIFNRLVMIGTLIAIAAFVRFNPKSLLDYGLKWEGPRSASLIMLGFFGGLLTLGLLAFVKYYAGTLAWAPKQLSAFAWILKGITLVFTGFLIGVIEEVFFRGVVFQKLRGFLKMGNVVPVILTSVFYAFLHFVSVVKPPLSADPGMMDSLKLVIAPIKSFLSWQLYERELLGLFLFGVILNILAIRTKNLMASIGLHAGCIFFVKFARYFVEFLNGSLFYWGSGKMYDGAAGWIALILMGAVLTAAVAKIQSPMQKTGSK